MTDFDYSVFSHAVRVSNAAAFVFIKYPRCELLCLLKKEKIHVSWEGRSIIKHTVLYVRGERVENFFPMPVEWKKAVGVCGDSETASVRSC